MARQPHSPGTFTHRTPPQQPTRQSTPTQRNSNRNRWTSSTNHQSSCARRSPADQSARANCRTRYGVVGYRRFGNAVSTEAPKTPVTGLLRSGAKPQPSETFHVTAGYKHDTAGCTIQLWIQARYSWRQARYCRIQGVKLQSALTILVRTILIYLFNICTKLICTKFRMMYVCPFSGQRHCSHPPSLPSPILRQENSEETTDNRPPTRELRQKDPIRELQQKDPIRELRQKDLTKPPLAGFVHHKASSS